MARDPITDKQNPLHSNGTAYIGVYRAGAQDPRRPQPKAETDVEAFPDRTKRIVVSLAKERQEREDAEDKIREEMPFPLTFRGIEADDFHFVLNAWMRSYRDCKRTMKNSEYFQGQQNLIAELAKRRQLVIGCDADTPAWIAGFCCGTLLDDGRLLLDYVYVKQAYRERGIGRGLLGAVGWREGIEIVATHWNRHIDKVARRYNVGFNDYFNSIGFSDV